LSEVYSPVNLLKYVSDFRKRLFRACEFARKNVKATQTKMKLRYDGNTKLRSFRLFDKVHALLSIDNNPLHARYFGSYIVD
jgi:hypothetical protein